MNKIQYIENRFLGIVFLVFTILIGVFALTEFLNLNPNISGKVAGSIFTKVQHDSTSIIDEKTTDTNILPITTSVQGKEIKKDSIVKYSALP